MNILTCHDATLTIDLQSVLGKVTFDNAIRSRSHSINCIRSCSSSRSINVVRYSSFYIIRSRSRSRYFNM